MGTGRGEKEGIDYKGQMETFSMVDIHCIDGVDSFTTTDSLTYDGVTSQQTHGKLKIP